MSFYEKTGMILEGGGSKGVFTAGVLDYLMHMGVRTSYVAGVSAGACNAVDYVSEQPERTKKCTIIREKALKFASIKNIAVKRSYFDMDLIFDRFPNELIPFDYDTYFDNVNNGVDCETVITNCITGKSEYWDVKDDRKLLMDVVRASSTLPFLAPVVNIKGTPYMDGGFSDSIPLGRSFRKGNTKNIVILTKSFGYRKKKTSASYARLMVDSYGKYPGLCRAAINRSRVYNRQLDIVERLEREGRIFVLRPTAKPVSRTERNPRLLDRFYENGIEEAEKNFDALMRYLEEGNRVDQ